MHKTRDRDDNRDKRLGDDTARLHDKGGSGDKSDQKLGSENDNLHINCDSDNNDEKRDQSFVDDSPADDQALLEALT